MLNRRTILKTALLGAGGLVIPWPALASAPPGGESRRKIRFGLCADVHKDVMHDADERLEVFVSSMNREKADFVMQLGDFCRPYSKNDSFLRVWNQFAGPKYHVLGNHDMDGGFKREEALAFWGAESKYYSFDVGGCHFVILDGNDKKENPAPGYARYIGENQLEWLGNDLRETDSPTFLFSHQSLECEGGVENGEEIRAVLEEANRQAGHMKIAACFSGHHHLDYHVQINAIQYIQINSMSYYWLGGDYLHQRYSETIEEENPWLRYTAPYRDPLFALVTLDPSGAIEISGIRSEFVPPAPVELNHPGYAHGHAITASIENKQIADL